MKQLEFAEKHMPHTAKQKFGEQTPNVFDVMVEMFISQAPLLEMPGRRYGLKAPKDCY